MSEWAEGSHDKREYFYIMAGSFVCTEGHGSPYTQPPKEWEVDVLSSWGALERHWFSEYWWKLVVLVAKCGVLVYYAYQMHQFNDVLLMQQKLLFAMVVADALLTVFNVGFLGINNLLAGNSMCCPYNVGLIILYVLNDMSR